MNITEQAQSISLIGMSHVGKSYWSQRFAEQFGYERICCDDEIAERLKPELKSAGFTSDIVDITDVAEWMGTPDEEHSRGRQLAYLSEEERVVQAALARLPELQRVVIDTTGSVIYLSEQVLRDLRKFTTVVYLKTHADVQAEMLQAFLKKPKPVVWGDGIYAPNPGEDPTEAIRRCYPNLLTTRAAQYERLAHVTIPWNMHRDPILSTKDLLNGINSTFTTPSS